MFDNYKQLVMDAAGPRIGNYLEREGYNQEDTENWLRDRDVLELKWADEDWIKKAIINSNNRTSSDGSLHTGGSIPTTEHYKRLKNSSDETPTCWDLFEKTHKMKGQTPKWISSKSEKIAVVGGVDKKKRIRGLGLAGENYIPSSKRSTGI